MKALARRASIVVAALAPALAAGVSPGAALAVDIRATDAAVVYTAAAGEANRTHVVPVAGPDGPRLRILDYSDLLVTGGQPATVTVAEPCVLVRSSRQPPPMARRPTARAAHVVPDEIECPMRPVLQVALGDLGDTFSMASSLAIATHLEAGDGNDAVATGSGPDALSGGAGRDILSAGLGPDSIDGGAGTDVVRYEEPERTTGVVLKLPSRGGDGSAQDGPAGARDRLAGIEDMTGTRYRDVITGDGGRNDLAGGAGDDILSGRAGDDVLSGGEGRDRVSGGRGEDSVIGRDGDADRVACDDGAAGRGRSEVVVVDRRDRVAEDCETVAVAGIFAVQPPMAIGARARLTAGGRRAQVRLGCDMLERCTGSLTVRDAGGARLGRRSFRIGAGHIETVTVNLRRRPRARQVAVTTVTRDLARHATTTTRRVLLAR